ncbi:MAG: methionyl-tRNA formyltransferase [Alphaproteobacteria bacterium GM202ARS2]|nr:methionyl-tRNA formyltransferase [Alphaproteobacteria bacterium GM202ARS2]
MVAQAQNKTLRVLFMGSQPFSLPTLETLYTSPYDVVAVVSPPPSPQQRGQRLRKNCVHSFAEQHGIAVMTPKHIDETFIDAVVSQSVDVIIVVAYGLLLPSRFLSAARYGCINVHPSLLPRWRGAAPIARAIMAGDSQTGVSIMQTIDQLDAGPILLQESTPIDRTTTAEQLAVTLAHAGARLIDACLSRFAQGTPPEGTPQQDKHATYAKKLYPTDTKIPWQHTAAAVHNHIRGLCPKPGAWCWLPHRHALKRLKILATTPEANTTRLPPATVLDGNGLVKCGTDAVRIAQLQLEGKAPMSLQEFLCGTPLPLGTTLQ